MRSRLFVVFAAVCFATTGTAQQLGPDTSSPLAVATIRFMIGSLVFFVAVRSTGVAVGTAIAIVGLTLIVTAGKSSAVTTSGVALAWCAGLGYALFALGSKTILSSGMSSEAAMARVFGITSLLSRSFCGSESPS